MAISHALTRQLAAALLVAVAATSFSRPALANGRSGRSEPSDTPSALPFDEFSPAFLGVYRKVMEIEPDILKYSTRYGVDPSLARAVCMYESGGNATLTSGAGAHGYFQVMPATFRLLRVPTNVEAGIKYLGQLVEQFGREDYALAAYNGGPGRVMRRRGMPLESLQYVLGVGYYRSVLKMYEPSVRAHAAELRLATSTQGDDWWSLSRRLEVPLIQLRLFNPFLNDQRLTQARQSIAYPRHPRLDLFDVTEDGRLQYRARIGDNYFNVAFAFDADLDQLRTSNELWRLQLLLPGMVLTVPLGSTDTFTSYRVRLGEELTTVAARLQAHPWQIIRDNNLWDEQIREGMMLRIRLAPQAPALVVHRVSRGENLGAIARRYGTTISAIQGANSLGGRTVIRIGERLRIPKR